MLTQKKLIGISSLPVGRLDVLVADHRLRDLQAVRQSSPVGNGHADDDLGGKHNKMLLRAFSSLTSGLSNLSKRK